MGTIQKISQYYDYFFPVSKLKNWIVTFDLTFKGTYFSEHLYLKNISTVFILLFLLHFKVCVLIYFIL